MVKADTGLGIAIVGASKRSTFLCDYLRRHPDAGFVTGYYDEIPGRAKLFIDHYGLDGAVLYASLDEAVNDPRAAAVFVTTTDFAHAEGACAAIEAGKHVYCEKPLAITLEDCDRIVAAARQARGVFYVGMNMRHSPVHEKIHEYITSGKLGKVLTIESNEHYNGGRTYFRRWNRLRKFGGGLWITKACHDLDMLNWMAGGHPVRIWATSGLGHYKALPEGGTRCRDCAIRERCPDVYEPEKVPPLWEAHAILGEEASGVPRDVCLYNSEKDTFDHAMTVAEYDNGVRANYTVNVVAPYTTRQMRIFGTKGAVEGDTRRRTLSFNPRNGGEPEELDLTELMNSGHGGADERILADFFRCCREGDRPRSSWAEGRLSVQLGLAARESCDTGKPIVLS